MLVFVRSGIGYGERGYIKHELNADRDCVVLKERIYTSDSLLKYDEVLDKISDSVTVTNELFAGMQTREDVDSGTGNRDYISGSGDLNQAIDDKFDFFFDLFK